MDKREAIEFLKQYLSDIPQLAKLDLDNEEYPLWYSKIRDIIEAVFGRDSSEYQDFVRCDWQAPMRRMRMLEGLHRNDYISNLKRIRVALKGIIQKYETLGIEEKPDKGMEPPKAFVSNNGEKRPFEKAWKIEIRGDDIATLYPIVRTVASELRLENFAFEARPAKSITTNSYAWFNVLIISTTTASKIPVGAFTLQKLPEGNTIELRIPPPSEWGRYDLNPGELAVMAYSGSEYDEHFSQFIKRLQAKLKPRGLKWLWKCIKSHKVPSIILAIITFLAAVVYLVEYFTKFFGFSD